MPDEFGSLKLSETISKAQEFADLQRRAAAIRILQTVGGLNSAGAQMMLAAWNSAIDAELTAFVDCQHAMRLNHIDRV